MLCRVLQEGFDTFVVFYRKDLMFLSCFTGGI